MSEIICFIAGILVGFIFKNYQHNKFLTENLTKTESYVISKLIIRKKHKNKNNKNG